MNNLKKILTSNSQGQTLVEMVVATGMVALVLVAIVSGITLSIRNSRFSKNKAIATRYAQETVEKFRNYRDEYGWEPFLTEVQVAAPGDSTEFCIPDLPVSVANISEKIGTCSDEKIINTGGNTEFSRYATVSNNADTVEIEVTVSWFEGSKTHLVNVVSRLNDWTL